MYPVQFAHCSGIVQVPPGMPYWPDQFIQFGLREEVAGALPPLVSLGSGRCLENGVNLMQTNRFAVNFKIPGVRLNFRLMEVRRSQTILPSPAAKRVAAQSQRC